MSLCSVRTYPAPINDCCSCRSDHEREVAKLSKQLQHLQQSLDTAVLDHAKQLEQIEDKMRAAAAQAETAASEAAGREERLGEEVGRLKRQAEETTELLAEKTDKIESLGEPRL